jgi:RNA polymerase sigma factor (sigma-70 family)
MLYSDRRDELDQRYNELIREAQEFPKAAQRNLILNKLFRLILTDNRIYLSYQFRHGYRIDYDDYQDCLQQTMMETINNIDAYELEKGSFINWFNKILRYNFIDQYRRKRLDKNQISLDTGMVNVDNKLILLDMIADNNNEDGKDILIEELVNFINNDPAKVLENCHIRQNLDCNCKTIAQLRFNGSKWNDISEQLQIPMGTIVALWSRKCIPLLRQHLQHFLEKKLNLIDKII